jgi:hypothetical protein
MLLEQSSSSWGYQHPQFHVLTAQSPMVIVIPFPSNVTAMTRPPKFVTSLLCKYFPELGVQVQINYLVNDSKFHWIIFWLAELHTSWAWAEIFMNVCLSSHTWKKCTYMLWVWSKTTANYFFNSRKKEEEITGFRFMKYTIQMGDCFPYFFFFKCN